jgi:3-oxoacyl-[acyl-carrier protein] reductase
MTHVLAKELGPRQITVNAVAPGQVETVLFLEGKTDDELKYYADRVPLGRLGQPKDIVGIVAFLAGPEASWLSGQVIRVNGGGV